MVPVLYKIHLFVIIINAGHKVYRYCDHADTVECLLIK